MAPLRTSPRRRPGRPARPAAFLRGDLDPVLALLSLVGMCAFPFLAHPLLGPVLGYQLDEDFRRRLADHSVRLFLDGARGDRS